MRTTTPIFVSVASYRDSELVPTIQDALAKARHPDRLRIGVCWQHGDDEDAAVLRGDRRVSLLDVPWQESQGACWARAEIVDRLYAGEELFLQIDSHHRFVSGWDVRLLAQLAAAPADKPVVTAYCPVYQVGEEPDPGLSPLQLVFHKFSDDGIPAVRPVAIPGWRQLARPVRARCVSGHFLLARGSFVEEVPYDPTLYFFGEEISLAVRAFTWGYDLFHPPEVLMWHNCGGRYRRKHWDDHTARARGHGRWRAHDRAGRVTVRALLLQPTTGRFGCGPVRTVADYASYAGLDFRARLITPQAQTGVEPGVPAVVPGTGPPGR